MFGRKKDFKLKLTGRAGLIYEENGKSMRVDSEMLVGPTHDIVIYKDSIKSWAPPFEAEVIDNDTMARILKNIISELEPRYKIDVT
jgi:hypothetical protein